MKALLAEGMIVINEKLDTRNVVLECAAPILRAIMLTHVIGPKINIPLSEVPSELSKVDPWWLLACTIEVSV